MSERESESESESESEFPLGVRVGDATRDYAWNDGELVPAP